MIIKKRNFARLKKALHTTKEEGEATAGCFRTLNQAEYVTTNVGLVSDIVKELTFSGFAVVDNFINAEIMSGVRSELTMLCNDSTSLPGKLCCAKSNAGASIRSDMVRWLDIKHDCPYTAIHTVVRRMDRVTSILNTAKILSDCDIRSRSPAMLACYPAKSSGYKQHVDNPNEDGRKLTFILYTTPRYDKLRDGGALRIHKADRRLYYDIEPLDGRLVIFWSDCRTPHEVLPTNRTRYAISVWYFDLIERARTLVKLPSRSSSMLQQCFIT